MLYQIPVLNQKIEPVIAIVRQAEEKPKTPKQEYIIQEGDTLTSIAKAHSVDLSRLWSANPQLTNPDQIKPSDALTIPKNTDVLKPREFPVKVEIALDRQVDSSKLTDKPSSGGFSVSGNSYAYGYCTWYAKEQRPDLPNDLGNADTWYYRYQGAKGDTPAVGAVAATRAYMHVAIVTSVNGDTVTVSEMNYQGWGVVSSRTAPASEFHYLY